MVKFIMRGKCDYTFALLQDQLPAALETPTIVDEVSGYPRERECTLGIRAAETGNLRRGLHGDIGANPLSGLRQFIHSSSTNT